MRKNGNLQGRCKDSRKKAKKKERNVGRKDKKVGKERCKVGRKVRENDRRKGEKKDERRTPPTCLPGKLHEGLNATLAITALRRQGGHVVPAHRHDDIQHGLSLVRVRRHHPREEVVSGCVAELRRRRGVADLGDLQRHSGGSGKVQTRAAGPQQHPPLLTPPPSDTPPVSADSEVTGVIR